MFTKIAAVLILLYNIILPNANAVVNKYNDSLIVDGLNSNRPNIDIMNLYSQPKLINIDKLQEKSLSASGMALIDLDSNTLLYTKNSNQEYTIASITKIATALAVIRNYNLDEVATVSYRAASINGSKIYLNAGEKITVRELIYGMLIASGNDAAIALADHYGEDKLLLKMNELSKELGLQKTHFLDASGLTSENRSTPNDLAILAKAALSEPIIRDAAQTIAYTIRSVDGSNEHLIHTTNRLLKNYPDIIGLKTGYTDEAKYCLISASERNNHKILLVLLGARSDDARFDESREVLNFAWNNIVW